MKKLIGTCGLLLALTGCGTSPEPNYYMLAPVNGVVAPGMVVNIQIDRPVLPDYLDRPSIVYQTGAGGVEFDDDNRWAAPLDTMVEDVLTDDLRQRMPASVITKEKDDLPQRPSVVVEPEIETFNETDDGAVLRAQLLITSKCEASAPLSVGFGAVAPTQDVLAGQSELIGIMADQITVLLAQRPDLFCDDAEKNKQDIVNK